MGVGLALGAASVGLSTIGSYQQQSQMNAQLRYQAAMNRINSQLETMSADSELRKGEKEQQQIMVKGGRLRGQQKANYAASGIDLHSRSAQNALNASSVMTEVDKNQAAANALSNAWQHRLKSTDYNNMANILSAQQQSPWGAAFGTAVKGLAGLGLMYGSEIGSWFKEKPAVEVLDRTSTSGTWQWTNNSYLDLNNLNYGLTPQTYTGNGINSAAGLSRYNGIGINPYSGKSILGGGIWFRPFGPGIGIGVRR